MINAAARALKLQKEVKHLTETVKVFTEERQGCIESITRSVKNIQAEWAKMERYNERIKAAQGDLTKFSEELVKVRKQADKDQIQETRKLLLAQLAALEGGEAP